MTTDNGDVVRDNFYTFHLDAAEAPETWGTNQPRE